jgi:hypothetical protein
MLSAVTSCTAITASPKDVQDSIALAIKPASVSYLDLGQRPGLIERVRKLKTTSSYFIFIEKRFPGERLTVGIVKMSFL